MNGKYAVYVQARGHFLALLVDETEYSEDEVRLISELNEVIEDNDSCEEHRRISIRLIREDDE